MPPLFPLTLALYAVACTLYFVAVAQPQLPVLGRAARPVVVVGFLCQAIDIAWLCVHGQHPGSSAREAIFFAAWLIVGAFPLLTWRQPIPLLGALLLPVAMVFEVVVRAVPTRQPGQLQSTSMLLATAHIVCATLGIALFAVAAAASVMYLLRESRLKHHKRSALGPPGRRGPSLELLDGWNRYSIAFGMLVFTGALVTGTLWLLQHPLLGDAIDQSGGVLAQARFLLRHPQYTLAVVTWLLYAGLLCARVTAGMRGRRAALVTLFGFATGLSVLLVYLLRDARAFGS